MKSHRFYKPTVTPKASISSIPEVSKKVDPHNVRNNAGGFVFSAGDIEQLRRFLILGGAGTYYRSGDQVVLDNLKVLDRVMDLSKPSEFVDFLVDMRPRVPSSKTLIASMAYSMRFGSVGLKRELASKVNNLLWTGDDLMRYLSFCKEFQRGWGRVQTRLVNNWYNERRLPALALQMIKYKGRYGWTQRDILKLGSVAPKTAGHDALYAYVVARVRGGDDRYNAAWKKVNDAFDFSKDPSEEQRAMLFLMELERMWALFGDGKIDQGIAVAYKNKFPWELLPSELLDNWNLWDSYLLDAIGPRALLRNVNRLSKMGIGSHSEALEIVWDKFHDQEWLQGAHPASIVIALMQYSKGVSASGDNSWPVSPTIEKALDEAFIQCYGMHSLLKNGEKMIVAVDVSPSMHASAVDGIGGMKAVDIASLMAAVFVRGERAGSVIPLSFSSDSASYSRRGVRLINIDSRSTIKEIHSRVSDDSRWGGTDCSLPFVWAMENGVNVECVIVITDNETWAGKSPNEALKRYRETINPNARLVVVATTPTGYSIADPNDPLSLNIVGFDTAAPQVIDLFLRGEF